MFVCMAMISMANIKEAAKNSFKIWIRDNDDDNYDDGCNTVGPTYNVPKSLGSLKRYEHVNMSTIVMMIVIVRKRSSRKW